MNPASPAASGNTMAVPPEPARPPVLNWRTLAVTAAAGIGAGLLLQRLAPAASPARSLIRYAIMLAPAAFYCVDRLMLAAAQRSVEPPPLPPSSDDFSVANPDEQARQRRLGLHPDQILPVYTMAWLNHTDSVSFTDDEIRKVAKDMPGRHRIVGMMLAAKNANWDTRRLPGSVSQYNHNPHYGACAGDAPFSYEIVLNPTDSTSPCTLPLAYLRPGEVLLVGQEFQRRGRDCFKLLAIERQGADRFQVFDPVTGRHGDMGDDQVQQLMDGMDEGPNRTGLFLIRLARNDAR